jgi:hypothetical protein
MLMNSFDRHFLSRADGLPVGKIRLFGVELIFDLQQNDRRGRVWIPFNADNFILYGKNGAGKTTVINCLRAALSGDKSPAPSIHIDIYIGFEPGEADHFSLDQMQSLLSNRASNDEDEYETPHATSQVSNGEEGTDEVDLPVRRHLVGSPQHHLESRLTNSLARSPTLHREFVMEYDEFCRTFVRLFSPFYLGTEITDVDDIEDFDAFDFIPDREVYAGLTAEDSYAWLQQVRESLLAHWYQHDSSQTFWYGHGDSNKGRPHRELAARAFREAAGQSLYCLSPAGDGSWTIHLAAQLDDSTPNLRELNRRCKESHTLAILELENRADTDEALLNEINDSDFLNNASPSMALIDWDSPVTQFLGPDPEHPFVKLSSSLGGGLIKASELNLQEVMTVLDLASPLDLNEFGQDLLKDLFPMSESSSSSEDHSWMVSFAQHVDHRKMRSFEYHTGAFSWIEQRHKGSSVHAEALVESTASQEIDALMSATSESIAGLEIGLRAVRFEVSKSLHDWIAGRPFVFEAMDDRSGTWIPVDNLSQAQRQLVGAFLRFHRATQDQRVVLGLSDEPDQNLHITAVRSLLELIDQLFTISFTSTHSPIALATRDLKRLHVFRRADGSVGLKRWHPSSSELQAVSDLGVDRLHLLSTVSLVIVVEGAHDKVALERLLAASGLNDDRFVLIIPLRGHSGIATMADSLVWMEMTDAQILAVVDNGRASWIDKLREELLAAPTNTKSQIRSIFKRLEQAQSAASAEERTLIDLFERAVSTGTLSRVHAFGLSKGDIIEYLDPAEFELSDTWPQLRDSYSKSSLRKPFKEWLRSERGARISTDRVDRAFSGLEAIPTDMSDLLKRIAELS